MTFTKGILHNNCGYKFSNQSHAHNLYWWPPQHAIASYSIVHVLNLKAIMDSKFLALRLVNG